MQNQRINLNYNFFIKYCFDTAGGKFCDGLCEGSKEKNRVLICIQGPRKPRFISGPNSNTPLGRVLPSRNSYIRHSFTYNTSLN